jgi:hypothetical protein
MREKEPMTADRPGKITFGHLVSLGSRLTDRDRQIALDRYDHHVLTTEQLLRLHFAGLRIATARLDLLYNLRVLDRFRPKRGAGSTPYHWILDEAGAHVVAACRRAPRRRAPSPALAALERTRGNALGASSRTTSKSTSSSLCSRSKPKPRTTR